jgi:hypothetical protein
MAASSSETLAAVTPVPGDDPRVDVGACRDWAAFSLCVSGADAKVAIAGGDIRSGALRNLVTLAARNLGAKSLEAVDSPLAPLIAAEVGITRTRNVVSRETTGRSLVALAGAAKGMFPEACAWTEPLAGARTGKITPWESETAPPPADETFDAVVVSAPPEVTKASGGLGPYLAGTVPRIAEGGVLIIELTVWDAECLAEIASELHACFTRVNGTRPSVGGADEAPRTLYIAQKPYRVKVGDWAVRTGTSSTVRVSPDRMKVIKTPKPDTPYAGTFERELLWLQRLGGVGVVPHVLAANSRRRELIMSYAGDNLVDAARADGTAPSFASDWSSQLMTFLSLLNAHGLHYREWNPKKVCIRKGQTKDGRVVPGRLTFIGFGRVPAALADTSCAGVVPPAAVVAGGGTGTLSSLIRSFQTLGYLSPPPGSSAPAAAKGSAPI